jgi:hypothetical protein
MAEGMHGKKCRREIHAELRIDRRKEGRKKVCKVFS